MTLSVGEEVVQGIVIYKDKSRLTLLKREEKWHRTKLKKWIGSSVKKKLLSFLNGQEELQCTKEKKVEGLL